MASNVLISISWLLVALTYNLSVQTVKMHACEQYLKHDQTYVQVLSLAYYTLEKLDLGSCTQLIGVINFLTSPSLSDDRTTLDMRLQGCRQVRNDICLVQGIIPLSTLTPESLTSSLLSLREIVCCGGGDKPILEAVTQKVVIYQNLVVIIKTSFII